MFTPANLVCFLSIKKVTGTITKVVIAIIENKSQNLSIEGETRELG